MLRDKTKFSEFVQALASAYYEELVDHGYQPPPYDPTRKPCCTLSMTWQAMERVGLIKLSADGSTFDMTEMGLGWVEVNAF